MSYLHYVIAAYTVFAVVLSWDFIAPRLQVGQQLRAARLRAARADASKATAAMDPRLSANDCLEKDA
jgi:heme exporter protein D